MSKIQLNNVKLPFGLINERLKHIDDVPNGRACGCVCPKCKRSLEARNAGTIRAHYFAHYNSEECTGATETAIHLMAKQVIAESRTVKTPLFEKIPQLKDLEHKIHYGKKVRFEPIEINAEQAILEDQREGYKPDVTLIYKNKPLLVEIRVTHQVDDYKQFKVENNNEAMLEIDLSGADTEILLDMARFESYVIHEAPRHWIHNPLGNAQYKSNLNELHAYVEQINIKLRPKIEFQKKKAKQQEKQQLEFEARKAQEREKHADKLRQLELHLSPEWQKQRELSQQTVIAKFHKIEKIKNAEHTYNLSPLVDIAVKNSWVFNVHKSIWQADILTNIVFGKKTGEEINALDVKRIIVSRYGILPVIKELNILKQEWKQKGREREKWYQDSGCWFFSEQENEKIPSPFQPVIEYLKYLSKLRIIKPIDDYSFSVLFSDSKQYINSVEEDRSRQKIISEKIRAEEIRYLEREKQRLKGITNLKNARAKEIIASEKRLYELFNGKGRLCNSCYLFSHLSDGAYCPFCRASEFRAASTDAYNIKNAHHRYSCFTAPSRSVESNANINIELLAEWLSNV